MRSLTQEEFDRKDRIISELVKEILSASQGSIVGEYRGVREDLDLIGYLYYEGIQNQINQTLLKYGGKLLLGDVLVKTFSFEWRMIEHVETKEYCVISKDLKEPVFIERIEEYYSPPPIDEEPPVFSQYLCYAYECIVDEIKRKKYGLWLPKRENL